MTTRIILTLAVVGVLAGCTTTALQDNWGQSSASLITAQTANPESLTNPSTAIVTGVDGEYAYKVIEQMRGDVTKPEEVKQPIQMTLWGQGGQ